MDQNPYLPPATVVADAADVHVERPAAVRVGFVLLALLALLKILGGIFLVRRSLALGPEAGRALLVTSGIVMAVYTCAGIFFLTAAFRGRNWGRICVAIQIALESALMLSISRDVRLYSVAYTIGYFLPAIVQGAGVILFFVPGANAWYAVKRAAT